MSSCSVSRKATSSHSEQVSSFRFQDSRDSLREEISQNLNENLSEHEVVTWTVTGLPLTAYGLHGDTVKVERVTDRVTVRDRNAKAEKKKEEIRTEIVRDTVYVEKRDSVVVEKNTNLTNPTNKKAGFLTYVKWIFALICAVIVLIITVKVCLTFGFPPSRKA